MGAKDLTSALVMDSSDDFVFRVIAAAEVPPYMTSEYDGRGGWVMLAQFAQNWNWFPEHRHWMGREPLPEGTDPRRGALVAALVHALCVRDSLPIPEWVLDWRHPTPVGIAPPLLDGSDYVRSRNTMAPAVCDYHNAYFEVSFRDHR